MWDKSIAAINKYIPEKTATGVWLGHVNMDTGEKTVPSVTLYDAFWPALISLDGDLKRAAVVQDTWNGLWNKYGLEPMVYNYKTEVPTHPVYDLNPEIIESAWYLHHYTKEQRYLSMGQQYYKDMLKYCKTEIAFSAIADVRTMKQNNELPTFFFAETMKYFYLLFNGNPDINLEKYVFNTEAHPFKKAGFIPKEARKRLGFGQ